MKPQLAAEDDPRRVNVRAWLGAHPHPTATQLADAGYVAPHWPSPWGVGADPIERLIIDHELDLAGIERPDNPIGIGWAGPTIVYAGTPEQQQRYLPPMLRGEEFWCQLFSEPDAGSDLAALTTRARRDGDDYVVTGQKIWSSYADRAQLGILLARTDPDAAKQHGISYLICPMDAPGIEIRPIVEMTGGHHFNEVFFDEVRIPVANRIGEEHRGWQLAKHTLGNERVSLSTGGVCWGLGPTTEDLLDIARASSIADPLERQRVAGIHIEAETIRLLGERAVGALLGGGDPGPEASLKKTLADEHGQHVMGLAKDLAGPAGMLEDRGPLGVPVEEWHWGFLFSPALTIGGGTSEVQRSIIGERLLGLPRDEAAR